MAQNAELVRSMYDVFNRGDEETALAFLDEGVTWDFREAPDGVLYRGHEGIRQFFGMLGEVWASIRIELLAQEEQGDTVINSVRVVTRGKGSGADVSQPEAHIWRVRDGKLVEGKTQLDPEWARRT
jgi:uncharacterized protein